MGSDPADERPNFLEQGATPGSGKDNEEQTVSLNPIAAITTEANQTEALSAVDNKIHVVVKDQGDNRMEFLLKRTLPLAKLMTYYHETTGREPGFLRFHFDGQRIQESDTPDSVSLSLCM